MDAARRPGLPKNRLEALVDGTAAIVMTLLILEVKVPRVEPAELPSALLHSGGEMVAFVVSVLVVGAFWLGHNHHFNFLTHADRGLVWVNVVGLGVVAFIPFTTALLGHYWGLALPTALYGLNLGALGIVALVHWTYATRAGLVRHDLPPHASRDLLARTGVGVALAFLGAAAAFLSPVASMVLYALAFVPFALRGRYDDHLKAHA